MTLHPDSLLSAGAADEPPGRTPRYKNPAVLIGLGVVLLLGFLFGLYMRAAARTNHEALASRPKPVSVVPARATSFRDRVEYVGTIEPWVSARVGPQYISAYVGSVLVRPGAAVKRGEVLATLDCRNSSAASREVAARARALDERRTALAHETERTSQLTAGGFASANDVEQLTAKTRSEEAEVESLKASLVGKNLEVDDCILRAPFDGEVADRFVDPGAYLRPGNPVASVVDRTNVRITADAPESDFAVVAPGTEVAIHALANGAHLTGRISRRAPAADEVTRTVHFEIDLANAEHKLPAGTTATLAIDIGAPRPALAVPLRAATIRGVKATVFAVADGMARRVVVPVLGELDGMLYVDPQLGAGTPVVVEGRALLDEGDRVEAREIAK